MSIINKYIAGTEKWDMKNEVQRIKHFLDCQRKKDEATHV